MDGNAFHTAVFEIDSSGLLSEKKVMRMRKSKWKQESYATEERDLSRKSPERRKGTFAGGFLAGILLTVAAGTAVCMIVPGARNAMSPYETVLDQDTENKIEELSAYIQGAYYEETPVALCVDRNYYLIAYRAEERKYIHFRVDRMSDLRVAEEKRPLLPEGFDLASYVRTIFDMHSGERQWVTLELDRSLLNVAMDRFGREAHYRKTDSGTVVVTAQVEVSPTFLSWVLCFGGQAKILEPASAQEALRDLAQSALARYDLPLS